MQTSQLLSPDNSALSTAYYLARLVALQEGGKLPSVESTFHASTTDLWVNGLWFTSLTLSLAIALFAVLAKQWLRQYMSIVTGTPRERAFIRQFRYDGLKKWHVPTIVGIIPVVLHLSVIMFLVGLAVFLAPLSCVMAYTVSGMTTVIVLLYLVSTVLPLFAPECPYRTTFTDLIYYLHKTFIQSIWALLYSNFKHPPSDFSQQHYWEKKQENRQQRPDSFDSVERNVASPSNRRESDQHAELRALRWLVETTLSPSAKSIAFESLGAFHSKMTGDVSKLEEIFGDRIFIKNERGMRALVHFRALDAPMWPAKSSDCWLALTQLTAGYQVLWKKSEFINPGEGLKHAFVKWGMTGEEDISEVVWAGLFKRAEALELPMKDVPYGLLHAIEWVRAGGHATPRCLGDGVTMGDVGKELTRRAWRMMEKEKLAEWNSEPAGGKEDEEYLREWMKMCRLFAKWWPIACTRLDTRLHADDSCFSEWEEEAREALDVLLSAGRKADLKEAVSREEADLRNGFITLEFMAEHELSSAGRAELIVENIHAWARDWVKHLDSVEEVVGGWTERLTALDITVHVEEWKKERAKQFECNVHEWRSIAVQSGTQRYSLLRRIREWLPNRKVSSDSAV